MFKFPIFLLFLLLISIVHGQIYRVDLLKNDDPTDYIKLPGKLLKLNFFLIVFFVVFKFKLGGQSFFASLHSLFSDIIVVDTNCGIKPERCPKYCQDSKFIFSALFR